MVETVRDLLGDKPEEAPPVKMIEPPKLDGAPEWPGPGIHFGMGEDEYHAIYACSASGLKDLTMSSMDHWAKSVLNPDKEEKEEDSVFKALGRAYHVRILEGPTKFNETYAAALRKRDFTDLIVTVDDIRRALEDLGEKPKGSAKGPLIGQLIAAEPNARIWDLLVHDHAEANDGKIMLPADQVRRIQIAAAMIERDPTLGKAFTGGYPEVTLFWYDERTGAPMKGRLDYLKLRGWNDLKSFSNPVGRPIERAIDFTIATRKYYLPTVVYNEGVAAVKKLIRELGGRDCIHGPDHMMTELRHWCWEWAHQPEPEALMVFQQTGAAPVTRGRRMRRGTTYEVTSHAVQMLKRRWVECATTFGADPWIDTAPIRDVVDEEMPMSATDFGDMD